MPEFSADLPRSPGLLFDSLASLDLRQGEQPRAASELKAAVAKHSRLRFLTKRVPLNRKGAPARYLHAARNENENRNVETPKPRMAPSN